VALPPRFPFWIFLNLIRFGLNIFYLSSLQYPPS
jgi:hypothetical protein